MIIYIPTLILAIILFEVKPLPLFRATVDVGQHVRSKKNNNAGSSIYTGNVLRIITKRVISH